MFLVASFVVCISKHCLPSLCLSNLWVFVALSLSITHTASAPADVDKLLDIDQALVQIRTMKHKWRELAETVRLPETLIEQVSPWIH